MRGWQVRVLYGPQILVYHTPMRYKIYTKTEKAWDAMFSAISHAKSSILFEMYTFLDDTTDTHDFIKILKQKALEGVRIKIIIDSLGSYSFSNNSLKILKDAGVEVFIFKVLFRHTHRKILVIDERIGYVGGINITKFYKKWDDLLIKVDGKVVKYIIRSFARVYKDCGGKDTLVLKYDKDIQEPKGKVWFMEHFPIKNSFGMKKYYRDKLKLARKKILIVTPYFMPNRWVVKALKKTAKRGVEIEIILPLFADHPSIANVSNYFYMQKLFKHNIKFFLTKDMIHSKMMIVDEKEGIVGSQNMDIISFDLNIESGVFFTEPAIVKELNEIAENWKKDSVPYSPKMRNTHLLDYFYEFCFSVFEGAIIFLNRLTRPL